MYFFRSLSQCQVFLVAIVYMIGFQYVYPAIVNSVQYLDAPLMNTPKILERLLKIAVWTLISCLSFLLLFISCSHFSVFSSCFVIYLLIYFFIYLFIGYTSHLC
jgi:hypothetical protein